MFAKFGKRWVNVDNVMFVTKGGGESLNVHTSDGTKLGAAGEDALNFLKAVKIDAEEFFAEPEPAPAPEPAAEASEPEPAQEADEE